MGGCKCSFYNCGNNTTLAKETQSVHSHFFHFPIRNLKRCVEWAIYANRMEFLNLPLDKLKNKVICDYHFSENHFMNYTRSKLNKTTAVPTIYINEDKEEVDLLESPTDWVTANRLVEVPAHFKSETSTIDIDESVVVATPVKKIKLETSTSAISINSATSQPKVRILNKVASPVSSPSTATTNKIITFKQVKAEPPIFNQKVINPLQQQPKPIPPKVHKHAMSTYQVKSKVNESSPTPLASSTAVSSQFALVENNDGNETFEFLTVIPNEDQSSFKQDAFPKAATVIPDEIKEMFEKTSNDITDLKTMILSTSLTKATTPIKEDSSSITASSNNKVQLFNGIKRYLPPALTTLLRMELFGGPSREYRTDEKIICGELFKLGEETYNFMTDEWRLRLPSKDQVQQWLNDENSHIDDNDAC